MTCLEVNADIRTRTIHPANASNLRSGDTVRVELTLGPGLAIVDHLAHHVRCIVEDTNSDDFRASHVTSTGYGGPGLDLWELDGSVVPAAFAVVALLYYAMFHVLVVDTINRFSSVFCETMPDGISYRIFGSDVLNTVHAMSVPGIAEPRVDIFSQFPLSISCE
jgi:hypothetical protein